MPATARRSLVARPPLVAARLKERSPAQPTAGGRHALGSALPHLPTMATAAQWLEGARPRTLPAAVSPVLAGTGVATYAREFIWWKALLALVVALALQVAVNFANDYSDGIRGTDDVRVGPLRLVGSGAASPRAVRAAAGAAVAVACLAGLVLAATTNWALVAFGALAVAAAWFYTGGPRPYGYVGLGEVSVFVFFGLVAVTGTAYVQMERFSGAALVLGAGVGALACGILVANNLRDASGDEAVGKRTLAVRWGDARSRDLFAGLHAAAYVCLLGAALLLSPWVLLGLVSLPLSVSAVQAVRRGARGSALIAVLRDTGLTELAYAVGVLAGLLAVRLTGGW
jgi:1,4-dihydroxy-2-naphthoate polyprenyltransferase